MAGMSFMSIFHKALRLYHSVFFLSFNVEKPLRAHLGFASVGVL